MAFDFPSSPTLGQQFAPVAGVSYTWNGYGWVLAGAGTTLFPRGGQLRWSSVTALSFTPMNGNGIMINGVVSAIPSGGITGLANTSVFVNGVAGQNLAASTTYYIYCFNNAGTLTADYSTTGHATSSTAGNVGTEIKSGDDTRTLIGMCRTNASSQFADANAALTWFNRTTKAVVLAPGTIANQTTTSTTYAQLVGNLAPFLIWANSVVQVNFAAIMYVSSAGQYGIAQVTLDTLGGTQIFASTGQFTTAAVNSTAVIGNFLVATEGFHVLSLNALSSVGTNTLALSNINISVLVLP